MNKWLSFSIYGSKAKYCVGFCKNIHLAKHFYPDYRVACYMDDSVPLEVKTYALDHGVDVRRMSPELGAGGMFHRFLINDDLRCSRYLVRDADSRVNEREVKLVRLWEESGLPFHVIRDHPHHSTDILGCSWGATRDAIGCTMEKRIKEWNGVKEGYDADQEFLRKVIWPLVRHRALQHDSCTRHKYKDASPIPLPLSYDNPRFVGEVFDHLDRPRAYDWEKMLMAVEVEEFGQPATVVAVTSEATSMDVGGVVDRDEKPPRLNLKPPLFIRTHLGLGDALIQNALVRAKAKEHSSVAFPCKKQNIPSVSQMFSDLPNVIVEEVKDDNEADALLGQHEGDTLLLGMFGNGWKNEPGWDKRFYEQAGVPWEDRWEKFHVPVTVGQVNDFVPDEFMVVHDDMSRKFTIPRTRLPKLPYVQVGPTKSLFDYGSLIWCAKEVHCIDSCVAILADSIPTVADKLVLHAYATKGKSAAGPPMYRKKWTVLKK